MTESWVLCKKYACSAVGQFDHSSSALYKRGILLIGWHIYERPFPFVKRPEFLRIILSKELERESVFRYQFRGRSKHLVE
jgi:hypothetical protein